MATCDVTLELERVLRNRSVHGPLTGPVSHRERFVPVAARYVVFPAAAYVSVVVRVQREEHAQVPVGIDMEHQEESVVAGLNLNACCISSLIVAVIAQPNADGRVPLHSRSRRIGRVGKDQS
jgi:hypothetical protein